MKTKGNYCRSFQVKTEVLTYPPPFLLCHISIVSLHRYHQISMDFATPPPPHFYCFLYTTTFLLPLPHFLLPPYLYNSFSSSIFILLPHPPLS